jgi:single-strand DNA-binding protein
MIKMQLIGHLGQDAVVNNVNGKTVINFSVAHSEKFKNKEGVEVNKSVWVSAAYWTDRTAVAPYLKKGSQVYVEGSPEAKTYRNQNTNEVMPQLSLRVTSIQLIGGSKQGNTEPQSDFISQSNGFELTEE